MQKDEDIPLIHPRMAEKYAAKHPKTEEQLLFPRRNPSRNYRLKRGAFARFIQSQRDAS